MAKQNIFREPTTVHAPETSASSRIVGRIIQLDGQDPTTYAQFLSKIPGDADYKVTNRYGAPYVTLTLGAWAQSNADRQAAVIQTGSFAQKIEDTVIGDVKITRTGKRKPLTWNIRAPLDGDTELLLTHERQYLHGLSRAGVLPGDSDYFLHANLHIATVEMSRNTPEDAIATRLDRVQTFLWQVLHGRQSEFEPAEFLGK